MKVIKFILIALLFVVPIGIHAIDSSNTTYMMTPLGALSIRDNEFEIAFHNFKWYTEDGRWEYAGDSLTDDTKLFAILYMSDLEISWFDIDNNLSTEGLLTLLIPYILLAALLLLFIPGFAGALLSDILLLASSIMSLVSYLTYVDRYGGSYDTNFPIFAIVGIVFTILGLVLTIKMMKNRKTRGRKRRR